MENNKRRRRISLNPRGFRMPERPAPSPTSTSGLPQIQIVWLGSDDEGGGK